MPDTAQNLQTLIRSVVDSAWHVGEAVPDDVTKPVIYVRMSGETETDDLCPEVDTQIYDVEIACKDIDQARAVGAALKAAIRELENYPDELPGVQFVAVENHDQDYIPELVVSDGRVEVETLLLTLHF